MTAPRILIGGIFLESHSFAHLRSDADSFVMTRGAELMTKVETSGSILGGGARELLARGAQLIPTFSAVAPPGGLAEHELYLSFREALLEAVRIHRPDGVFLELHGAMGTTQIDDSEGDLASRLREVLGPDRPIAAGLDMHACMTRRMMQATPLWVACKENPHTDYPQAGARAADLLLRTLEGSLAPVGWATWMPVLLRGQLNTADPPLARLHAIRQALEAAPEIEDISIYNAYPYLDCAETGQCVTAISSTPGATAPNATEMIARALWDTRAEFEPARPTAEAALAGVRPGGPPLILGDFGDRVLGGSAGDGTYLLHLLQRGPAVRALVPLTDPAAVHQAQIAGPGGVIPGAIGGGVTPGEDPVPGPWTVKSLGDGRFVQRGPFLANEPAEMGPSAVLTAGGLTVLASTKPALSQDPACFLSMGEDPAGFDVVVCKSGVHFEPAFASYGATVAVDSPGLTNYVPGRFPFARRPPCWPEAPEVRPDFRVHAFPTGLPTPTLPARSPHA